MKRGSDRSAALTETAAWWKSLKETNNQAFLPLFFDRHRYLVLKGGGGSGKSIFAGRLVLERVLGEPGHRWLVCRKVARTLRDSCFAQLRGQLAEHYYRTRELYGAALYAGAIQGKSKISFRGREFGLLGADGKPLFAKDHPAKVKGDKQSNLFADAFSASALGKLETRMQNFKGDNDNILDVAPTTILIPNDADAKEAVFAAIGADKDPATANNAFNYQFGRWNVICWTYLNQFLAKASTFPWVLLDESFSEQYGGAVWYDRTKLDVRSEVAANDANVWKGFSRFVAGFADWRFAAVGGVAGGDTL